VAAALHKRGPVLLATTGSVAEAKATFAALSGANREGCFLVLPLAAALAGPPSESWAAAEIWNIAHNGYPEVDDPIGVYAREIGARYRRFDLGPLAVGPDEDNAHPFSRIIEALEQTIEEVASRDARYFAQEPLRTSLPKNLALLDPASAASEILVCSEEPAEHWQIVAMSGHGELAQALSSVYGIHILFEALPSSLRAVDHLFTNKLLPAHQAWARTSGRLRTARSVTTKDLLTLISGWRKKKADSSRARQAAVDAVSARFCAHSSDGSMPVEVFGVQGPVILIVNAIAQNWRYWLRLIHELSRSHRVVTWTPSGQTDDRHPAMSCDHLQEMEAVLRKIEGGPVHLLGWCTGPKLCVRYFCAHPNRVATMTFLAGTYRPFGDNRLDTVYETTLEMVFKLLERYPQAAKTVRSTLLDALCGSKTKRQVHDDPGLEVLGRVEETLLASIAAPYADASSTLRYAAQIRDFWSYSIESDVSAVHVPALVIGAELDQVASPRLGKRVAEAMPNARYIELAGATHYCMHDRPREIAEIVMRFIAASANVS
jgi:pimeloyl-ACP methyl ester carboxylesterase